MWYPRNYVHLIHILKKEIDYLSKTTAEDLQDTGL